jgi:mannose-6-phosphate isomerase
MDEFVRLEAALVGKIWGGTRLGEPIGGLNVGESWVLSAIPGNQSTVATGEHAGEEFQTYLDAIGAAGQGANASVMDAFPTLIKFIDAAQPLSIQVHPDDAYANSKGMPFGKTEMWVILAADEGSFLYLGLKEKMTPEQFASAIDDGTIEERFNRVAVKPGDVFFIKAGLLHAIGGGILLAEVQQSSDTTYRVYDFGRLGADGKPRDLHIADAKACASLEPPTGIGPCGKVEPIDGGTRQTLGIGRCFATERYVSTSAVDVPVSARSFVGLVMLSGEGELELAGQRAHVKAGQTWFVPAQDATARLTGAATFLRVTVPEADGTID